MGSFDEEIEAFYLQSNEQDRLWGDRGELERIRTQAILTRYLPPPPAAVFDIGGAAGAYAFPLAEIGYDVHLIDPVALHLEQARAHAAGSDVSLASITKGDARQLEVASGEADAVLLLGPLYHLTEAHDRAAAFREAYRILRPGGVLFAAAISRFASLIDGLSSGAFSDPNFRDIIALDLASGPGTKPAIQLTSRRRISIVPRSYPLRPSRWDLRTSPSWQSKDPAGLGPPFATS